MAGSGVDIRLTYNGLPALAKALPAEVSRALRRGAFATEAGAKVRAPVRTGFLRSSIQTEGATPGSLAMRVIVGAGYGLYVHEGTRRMPPRPFLRETTAQTFPVVIRELQKLEAGLP